MLRFSIQHIPQEQLIELVARDAASEKKTILGRFAVALAEARENGQHPCEWHVSSGDYDTLCAELSPHADIDVLAVFGVPFKEGILLRSYLRTSTMTGQINRIDIVWPEAKSGVA